MSTKAHEALLQECRDLFRDNLLEAVHRTFDGMDQSLMELADKTTNYEQRCRYLDARDVALRHKDMIEAQFRRRLLAEFQERIEKSRVKTEQLREFSLDELSLVGEDDLNETLSFNDMATKMRRHCEEEMSALDQRAAVLLGRPNIDADENPFGAKVVSEAFKHACQQVDCPLDVRLVFLKSFETLALEGIRGTCRQVNDLLVANAILPKIRYSAARNESKPRPRANAGAATAPVANEAPASPQKQDMFSMLSGLLGGQAYGGASSAGGGPAGAGAFGALASALGGTGAAGGSGGPGGALGVGGAPLLQGKQLLGSLTSLQRGDASVFGEDAAAELAPIFAEAGNLQNVLRRLKDTSVGQGMAQVDALTLEIVSMLFDQLFEDPKVPVALKGLIGRLQLPMLKVAIADKELFSSRQHPARRLLDTFGQLGLRLPRDLGAEHEVFKQIEGYVDELVDGFQEQMDIFDVVRLKLEAIIAAEDARIALQMQGAEKKLAQTETLAVAKSECQAEIRDRLAANPQTPWVVLEFLAQQWIKYLVVVRARDGSRSQGWRDASTATDQLIWSVQPKVTPEDRRALTASIHGILRAIKEGVTTGGVEAEVAMKFYGELMDCHKAALRTTVRATQAPDQPAPAQTPQAEELLDFSEPVTLNNPFGEGKVEVTDDDLDFTQPVPDAGPALAPIEPAVGAAPARPAREKTTIRIPGGMVVGAWISIDDPQERKERHARLHYVSPKGSHFLFVDRQGNKVYECSRSMLAKRVKLGDLRLLAGEPDESLFDRIMDGIFGKLRAPVAHAA